MSDSGRRTIIAMSRQGATLADVAAAAQGCGWTIGKVISGAPPGSNRMAEKWARQCGIPVERHPGPLERLTIAARRQRNLQVVEAADALVALWDGQSRGTREMINTAHARGLAVFVYPLGI